MKTNIRVWSSFNSSSTEQENQCTYNVTPMCVRANIITVEMQFVIHTLIVCVCSLRYLAWNSHTPYFHLQPLQVCLTFPHYLIKDIIFEKKKKLNISCLLRFLYKFVCNILHSKKNWARYDKNVFWCSYIVPVTFVRFKLNLNLLHRFSKNSQISTFMKIRPVVVEFLHAERQTGRQTWQS